MGTQIQKSVEASQIVPTQLAFIGVSTVTQPEQFSSQGVFNVVQCCSSQMSLIYILVPVQKLRVAADWL